MKATTKIASLFLAAFALAGCPENNDDTDPPPTTPTAEKTTTTAAETTSAATDLQVDTGTKNPGVTSMVKAELDGRKDGGSTGPKIAIAGGSASFSSVEGWKDSKSGAFATTESADGKARWAGGTSSGGRDGASGALGLTNCTWNPDETATVGADELAASVADGICDRGAGKAKAASVTFSTQNVTAVGAWDDGGDSTGVFSIFRSAKKAATGGVPGGLAACCAALKQNSVSAPPEQKGAYLAAYGACQAMIAAAPPGAAAQLRGLLRGAALPAPCQ